MQKVRLALEALAVESFHVLAPMPRPRGTVHGHDDVTQYYCQQTDDDYTCWNTCAGTAAPAETCQRSCYCDTIRDSYCTLV